MADFDNLRSMVQKVLSFFGYLGNKKCHLDLLRLPPKFLIFKELAVQNMPDVTLEKACLEWEKMYGVIVKTTTMYRAFQRAGIAVSYRMATPEEAASQVWKFTTKNKGTTIRVRGTSK